MRIFAAAMLAAVLLAGRAAPSRAQEPPASVEGAAVTPSDQGAPAAGQAQPAPAAPAAPAAKPRQDDDGGVLGSLRKSIRRDAPQVDLPDAPQGGAIDVPAGRMPRLPAERPQPSAPSAQPSAALPTPPSFDGHAQGGTAPLSDEPIPKFSFWRPGAAPLPAEQNLRMRALSSPEIFHELGLIPSGDGSTALHRDGSPASPQELARLRVRLDEEPRARTQYPDFFSTLTREAFSGLKALYRQIGPQRPDFQDVALSPEGRDFLWSKTCHSVSEECNPHARRGSYQVGRFIAPEDLHSMWEAFGRPVWDPFPAPDARSKHVRLRQSMAAQSERDSRGQKGLPQNLRALAAAVAMAAGALLLLHGMRRARSRRVTIM